MLNKTKYIQLPVNIFLPRNILSHYLKDSVMFKGQKTLAALAVSLLFTAPVYAADEGSGEIHFKGEVIEAPCEIHQDDIDKEVG